MRNKDTAKNRHLLQRIIRARAAYVMLLPILVVYGVFKVAPIIKTMSLSFFNATITKRGSFIGLENFLEIFTSPDFLQALSNTLVFTIVSIPFAGGIALLLAVLVHSKLVRFKTIFKIIYFMPAVTSWVAIGYIWRWIYDYRFGLANRVLDFIGIDAVNWLGSPHIALLSLVLVNVWAQIGYFMVIYTSNLQTIPAELYEACTIDGSNAWQRFIYVTLPMMRPALHTVLLLSLILFLQQFVLTFIMTGGGPAGSTELIATIIYRKAFQESAIRYGFASAASVVLLILVLLPIVLLNRIKISLE